jgi:hypothetical protein
MVPSEEFMRQAAECARLAKLSGDLESRAIWNRMSERWIRCAVLARQYDPPPQDFSKSHRKAAHALGSLTAG